MLTPNFIRSEIHYSDCYYCKGAVKEQLQPREIRWQGRLYVIDNVPMGVCTQCGEKLIKPEVAKSIDAILEKGQSRSEPLRFRYIEISGKDMLKHSYLTLDSSVVIDCDVR